MRIHHKSPPVSRQADEQYEPINRFRAMLLRIWGPADGWDNPLVGTKFDPALRTQRQHEKLEERRERWELRKQHWDERLHHHHDGGGRPTR